MGEFFVKRSDNRDAFMDHWDKIPQGYILKWEAPKRTLKQNSALHKYFKMLADELNSSGLTVIKTLKKDAEIPWEPELVKKLLWKPVEKAMLDKEKTSALSTEEVNKVYDVLSRHLALKFGIKTPFPSRFGE